MKKIFAVLLPVMMLLGMLAVTLSRTRVRMKP